jgi:glycosyltransferase involved in cell wall biosynthesis
VEIAAIVLILVPVIAYLGYPLVLIGAATIAGRRHADHSTAGLPTISIVICAYNEAPRIGAKLESVIAALEAWPGAAEIVVGDDGSSDDTCAAVERFADRGVRLVRGPRGGKAATLNRIVPSCMGAVLVMSDADPLFDAGTVPALIAPFADPAVGAAAGSVETIRTGGRRGGRFAGADRVFRAYESAMRRAEDDLFGCVSADGGIYAIRAALMPHVVADATDDFYISTAAVAAGRRIAFAPAAKVYEHSIGGDRQQFRRRVRITVRGMTGLWRRRALMNPLRTGWYGVGLIMHKLARRLALLTLPPLWLLSGLLATRGETLWGLVFAGLSGGFALGAIGFLTRLKLPRPLGLAYGAMLHLAGLGVGVILFLAGRRYAQWTPQKAPA